MDGWNKPAIFAQTKDDYFKGETAVWPKWEIAGNQTCEDKRDCSEAEEGNEKLVNKSSWSPVEGIAKQEAGGWPGTTSKTIGQWNNGQNRNRCQNQYRGWTAASKDGPIMASKHGNNAFVDGIEKWEDAEGSSSGNHDGSDRWWQSRSSSQMVVKDSFSKSTHRDQSKYDNVKRQNDEWPKLPGDTPEGIVLDHIGRDCWRQSGSNVQMVNKDDNVRNNNYLARCTKAPAEAGDAFDQQDRDKLRQPLSNIQIVSKESLNSSAIWDQAADNNVKKETDGWPKWPVAPSKGENSFDHDGHDRGRKLSSNIQIVNKGNLKNSADWNRATDDNVKRNRCQNQYKGWTAASKDGPIMASKHGNNAFVDGMEKWEAAEGSSSRNHDGSDRWWQSRSSSQMVVKDSFSKSTHRDQSKYDNVKRQNDEWPKLPGDTPEGIVLDHIGRDCWRQSGSNVQMVNKDDNVRNNNYLARCTIAPAEAGDAFDQQDRDKLRQPLSNIQIVSKESLNSSAIWDQAADNNVKKETDGWPKWPVAPSKGENSFDHDGHDRGRKLSSNIQIVNKGNLKNSADWNKATDDNVKRNRCQNQYKGWTAASKDGPIMASKHGNNAFVDGIEKWEAAEGSSSRNHDGSDRWWQSRSSSQMVVKDSFSKSTHRDQSKYDNVKRQNDEWPKLPGDTLEGIVLDHIGRDCWRQSGSNVQMVNKDDNVRNNNYLARCTKAPAEAGDAFDQQDRDKLRQPLSNIQIVSKESLNSSAIWDQAADNNVKKETAGWSKWPVAPSKGENSFDHDGHDRGRQLSSNIQIVNKGNLKNSADWNRATDDNVKRKNNEWLKWPKMPSNDEDSFVHDDRDRCMQLCSNIQNINKGGNRSNFVGWDKATNDNVKRENDGLPNWSKAPSKDGDSFDHDGSDRWRQLSSNIRNTNEGNLCNFAGSNRETDDNVKKKNDGWPKTTEQFPSSGNKKDDLQSHRLTKSLDDDDWQKENASKNPDLGQNDDPWMPQSVVPKCNWNKSVSWTESTGEINQKHWGSGLAQTGSDPWKQVNPTVSPKAGGRKLVNGAPAVAQAESSDRKKNKWSGTDFKQNRWNRAISSSSIKRSPRSKNRKGRWIQFLERFLSEDDDDSPRCFDASPANSSKYDQNTPTVWTKSGSDSFDTNPMKWDSNLAHMGCNPRKRLSSCEVSKFGRALKSSQSCRRHFRGRSTTRFHALEHGHIQSKDIYEKVSSRVSDQYRDSTSQRSHQVSKKTRCLESDKWINFNDPGNQRDHLQDIDNYGFQNSNVGFRRESCGHDTSFNESKEMFHGRKDAAPCFNRRVDLCSGDDVIGKDFSELDEQFSGMSHSINRFMFQGLNHGDKLNHENFVNVLSSINQELCKTFIRDSNGQPQIVKDDEGFRDGTIKSMITCPTHNVDQVVADSPHDLKSHQKQYVCSQLPSITENSNSSDQRKQNDEQQANKEGTLSSSSLNRTSLKKQEADKQIDKKQESNSSNCEKDARADGKVKGIIYEKGLFLFKTELAEFVKEKLTPHWKEGRLSKEAFKNVVKRVVDKVVCVQGSNFPRTKERIDVYMSSSESKLRKLVQDYLEMFINT